MVLARTALSGPGPPASSQEACLPATPAIVLGKGSSSAAFAAAGELVGLMVGARVETVFTAVEAVTGNVAPLPNLGQLKSLETIVQVGAAIAVVASPTCSRFGL